MKRVRGTCQSTMLLLYHLSNIERCVIYRNIIQTSLCAPYSTLEKRKDGTEGGLHYATEASSGEKKRRGERENKETTSYYGHRLLEAETK
jgi:hypothetical protein